MAKNTTTEHSKNFEKVKNYYDRRLWGITRVRNAVTNPKSGPGSLPKSLKRSPASLMSRPKNKEGPDHGDDHLWSY